MPFDMTQDFKPCALVIAKCLNKAVAYKILYDVACLKVILLAVFTFIFNVKLISIFFVGVKGVYTSKTIERASKFYCEFSRNLTFR